MELRLAVLVTPSYRFDLSGLVRQVYGSEAMLGDERTSVLTALDPVAPFAVTHAEHHWIFDWTHIETWLTSPAISRGFHAVFAVHEGAGFYAFAMYENGVQGRLRIGTAASGVISDVGPVLDPEIATIAHHFGTDALDKGLACWSGRDAAPDHIRLERIGERVVVDLLAYQTGISIAEVNDSSQGFFAKDARRILSPTLAPLSRFSTS